jgi:hypothetical protein
MPVIPTVTSVQHLLAQSSVDSVATLMVRLMDRGEALLLQFLLDRD